MNTKAPFARDPGPAVVSDAELVGRVLHGDPASYELVMRRYNRRLFRVARSIVTDDSEAEDVVQEAYVRAYLKLDQFEGPAGFGAWLTRIAANEALGRVRRGERVVFLEDHLAQSPATRARNENQSGEIMASSSPTPEGVAANGELGRLLETAVDELPDEFRAVFVLRAVERLSTAETAESLSIRPETVKTRFHRARKLLQKSLTARAADQLPAAFQFGGARCDRLVAGVMERLQRLGGGGPK